MGDRGGGREPKGASLKKSKKNPGASAAKAKKASLKAQGIQRGPTTSLPPPAPSNSGGEHFDCGAALLSRQFDRDRDRVILRALSEGKCQGMLLWFADIEKQVQLADLCKTNSGVCYYATGIHPDNIDRTNKKSHEEWLEKAEELGKKAECLAILSGLNLSREMATHFSQESMLKASYSLAAKIHLPVVLHIADNQSLDRTLELLEENLSEAATSASSSSSPTNILLHDVITSTGAEGRFRDPSSPFLSNPRLYYVVTAAGISDPSDPFYSSAVALLRSLPLHRLLVASDSPWRTPQNLSDPYLRTLRNEPSNLPAIVQALADVHAMSVDQMAAVLRANSLRVLGLEYNESNVSEPVGGELGGVEDEEEGEEGQDEDTPVLCSEPVVEAFTSEPPSALLESSLPAGVAAIDIRETPTAKPSAAAATAMGQAQYSCVKCRKVLFSSNEVVSHTFFSGKKTVFKVGEEGLCASFVFVDLSRVHHLNTTSGTASCAQCGYKLGKSSLTEALCSCGKAVPGPIAKLLASKLDVLDATGESTALLAERAKLEASLRAEEEEGSGIPEQERRKIKKGKKHKSENRGNFSSFRNKSFIPNASKRAVAVETSGEGGGQSAESEGGESDD